MRRGTDHRHAGRPGGAAIAGFWGTRPVSVDAAAALYQAWLKNRGRLSSAIAAKSMKLLSARMDGAHLLCLADPSSRGISQANARSLVASCTRLRHETLLWLGRREILTKSSDNAVQLWTMSGDQLSSRDLVPSGNFRLFSSACSADGRYVVTFSHEGGAQVWNLSDVPTPRPLGPAGQDVFAAAVNVDGLRVATMSKDGTTGTWDLSRDPPEFQRLEHVPGNSGGLVAISADGRRVAATHRDGTIMVWDLSDAEPKPTVVKGHSEFIRSIALSSDGRRLVTGSLDHTARLWDLAEQPPTSTVVAQHANWVTAASFSSDANRVITGSADGTARVLDLSEDRSTSRKLEGPGVVRYAAFGPGPGSALTIGSDGTALAWDLTGGKPVPRKLAALSGLRHAFFSANYRWLLAAPREGAAAMWDLSMQGPPRPLEAAIGQATIAVSNDGQQVLTRSGVAGSTASLWDLRRDPPSVRTLEGEVNTSIGIAILGPNRPQKRMIIAEQMPCRPCAPSLWNLADDHPRRASSRPSDRGYLMSQAMSGDGPRVTTVWGVGTVDVWDLWPTSLRLSLRCRRQGRMFITLFSAQIQPGHGYLRFHMTNSGGYGTFARSAATHRACRPHWRRCLRRFQLGRNAGANDFQRQYRADLVGPDERTPGICRAGRPRRRGRICGIQPRR